MEMTERLRGLLFYITREVLCDYLVPEAWINLNSGTRKDDLTAALQHILNGFLHNKLFVRMSVHKQFISTFFMDNKQTIVTEKQMFFSWNCWRSYIDFYFEFDCSLWLVGGCSC